MTPGGAGSVGNTEKNVGLQPRAQRTRRALIEGATHEFAERGYAETTAKTIAARAGVAVGSFYEYFPNKATLLLEIGVGYLAKTASRSLEILEMRQLDGDLVNDAQRIFREVASVALEGAREAPGLHAVLRERRRVDPNLQSLWQRTEREVIDRIDRLLNHVGFRGDSSATALVLFGMIDGALEAHIDGRMLTDGRFLDAVSDAISAVVAIGLPPAPR
ncbi:MAG: TetR/AcrR family transcriptional regulator [Polyangiales bacterium]